jgi:hypothetical protein
MNDVPEWIKRKKAEDERTKAQNDARAQLEADAVMTIAANGNKFFQQFLSELDRNAGGLSEIGIIGHVTKLGKPGSETSCQMNVELKGLSPRLTYTVVHYDPGSAFLRCLTLEGQEEEIHLPLRPHSKGGIGVLYRERIIDAEELATLIVQGMVERVKPSRR